MDNKRAALAAAFLVSSFCIAPRAAAQDRTPGGPYAPLILLLPADARTLAMGNAGVAGKDAPLFFNPAQLTAAQGMSVSAERYSSSAAGGSLSSAMELGGGQIGVAMRMVNYEVPFEALLGDRQMLLEPGLRPGTSLEAIAGYARVVKGFRVGAAAKYAGDHADVRRVGRAAFDFGISKILRRTYTIGLAVQNVGSAMTEVCPGAVLQAAVDCTSPGSAGQTVSVRLPLRTTLGAAMAARPVGPLDLSATAAVSLLRANFVIPSGGAEVGYSWLNGYSIAVRAGARRPLPGEGVLTAGAGFTVDRFSIDYALETLAHSRVGHRIGIRVR